MHHFYAHVHYYCKCLHIAMAYRNYCIPFHYSLKELQWSWGNDSDTWRGMIGAVVSWI